MKIDMKTFWREILIGILILLLCWVGCQKPVQYVQGNVEIVRRDTIRLSDTVKVPGATLREWRKIFLPVHDTVYTIVEGMKTDTFVSIDTAWLYTEVPVHQYRDSVRFEGGKILHYDIGTIGWLDTMGLTLKQEVYPDPISRKWDISANVIMSRENFAPGIGLYRGKAGFMYFYDIPRANHVIGFSYRFR